MISDVVIARYSASMYPRTAGSKMPTSRLPTHFDAALRGPPSSKMPMAFGLLAFFFNDCKSWSIPVSRVFASEPVFGRPKPFGRTMSCRPRRISSQSIVTPVSVSVSASIAVCGLHRFP